MVRRPLLPMLVLGALLALTGAAALGASAVRVPTQPVAHNPVDALDDLPMDAVRYDPATHCTGRVSRGVKALVAWLQENRPRGEDWGSYRCEKWGRHSASLHAEGRAEDWHLDVQDPADLREATALIRLLLAPDRQGRPHALATRMGVEEIIWDCRYWSAGADAFGPYSACYGDNGKPLRHVDPTVAHRDHVHLGLTRAAANLRTSFWRQAR